ncbi:hypothetical protein ACFLUR_01410 [Chloroflexota bacterium]
MKKKMAWYMVGVLVLGLSLLAVSCGGTTSAPAEEPAVEEPAVEEPVVEEPAAPTSGTMAISHPLEGREDCLQCHGEGTFKPFPADHAEHSNDTCTACHQPAE